MSVTLRSPWPLVHCQLPVARTESSSCDPSARDLSELPCSAGLALHLGVSLGEADWPGFKSPKPAPLCVSVPSLRALTSLCWLTGPLLTYFFYLKLASGARAQETWFAGAPPASDMGHCPRPQKHLPSSDLIWCSFIYELFLSTY